MGMTQYILLVGGLILLSFVYHKFSAALHCVPLISASSRELARKNSVLRHTHGGGLCSLR